MRVLFHFTHKQTLGHTTRSVALASALCRHKAETLILQGGVPQPFINFPKDSKVLDIPLPFDDRSSFHTQVVVPSSVNKRAQFILKTAAEFSPDVFITEFFPFGRLAYLPELLPSLRWLRKKGTRIMASIGYPLLVDLEKLEDPNFAALHRATFAFFDKFMIHTPEKLETPYIHGTIQTPNLSQSYTTIIKNLKKKIIYTGYIFPEKMLTGGSSFTTEASPGSDTIIVSRGGGAVYPKIITTTIEAQRLIDRPLRLILACGPATSPQEMDLFRSCLKDSDKERVLIASQIDNLDDHLRCCSVSVSLCGYNTSVQIMRFGTPSVIIPFKNQKSPLPTNDQVARAKLLQEKFNSIALDYETLNPRSLANAIEQQMSRPRPKPAPASWFNGADTAARLIVEDALN